MKMSECEVIQVDNLSSDTVAGLAKMYVKTRMSSCSQSQFDDYLSKASDAGLMEVEAVKQALFMAVFNEMAIEAVVALIDEKAPPAKSELEIAMDNLVRKPKKKKSQA
jgi:hypothetical protein